VIITKKGQGGEGEKKNHTDERSHKKKLSPAESRNPPERRGGWRGVTGARKEQKEGVEKKKNGFQGERGPRMRGEKRRKLRKKRKS